MTALKYHYPSFVRWQDDATLAEKMKDERFSWFKGVIGAIDGQYMLT
jgi:hypothetical protein